MQLVDLSPTFKAYTGDAGADEARMIYKEIFTDHCYDTTSLPSSPLVVDAGANIGLFTLHIKAQHPAATVLAFEPAPATAAILAANLALHGAAAAADNDVHVHACALGRERGTARLTFFPGSPGNSTLVPQDKAMVRELAERELGRERVEAMFAGEREVDVEVRRLGSFLDRGAGGREVDLLKIDVEGAELDVLAGLDDGQWPLIRNIVMEIHNLGGDLGRVEELLRSKGFVIEKTMADWAPADAKFYMLTAKRPRQD